MLIYYMNTTTIQMYFFVLPIEQCCKHNENLIISYAYI